MAAAGPRQRGTGFPIPAPGSRIPDPDKEYSWQSSFFQISVMASRKATCSKFW